MLSEINERLLQKILLIATSWLSIFATLTPSIYEAGYNAHAMSFRTSLLSAILASIVLIIPSVFCAIFIKSLNLIRFIAGSTIALGIYKIFRIYFPKIDLGWGGKIALLIFVTFSLVFLIRHASEITWNKWLKIIFTFLALWIISLPAIAWLQDKQNNTLISTLSLKNIFSSTPKAVVILVLDEASPELSEILNKELKGSAHTLFSERVEKAGDATLYALPSMLTPNHYHEMTICGFSQLCGGKSFNMRKLKASSANIDVVGFYHPYCAIQGLRSCWIADSTKRDSPGAQLKLLKATLWRLELINTNNINTAQHKFVEDIYGFTRQSIEERSFKAPFWQNGGILFIHQLLPHPSGVGPKRTLADEYLSNSKQAAEFIGDLNKNLEKNFQGDYAIIITSDHPLRSSMWCSNPIYSHQQDCNARNFHEGNQVPFIVFSPKNLHVTLPTKNLGVFSQPFISH